MGRPAATAAPKPASTSTAAATNAPVHFDAYVGAYRSADGTTYVVNAAGHLVRLSDGWIRQLYATPVPDALTVGPGFMVETPKEADVTFKGEQLTISPGTTATRLPVKSTDLKVAASGADLAATITEPLTPGPHPGIVVVHGSERGVRSLYGVWVGLYTSLGFAVLTYDKRGVGDSTGQFPGDFASKDTLSLLADDANACLKALAAWPGVDSHRAGFHGGSQGGWIVPLAMQRSPLAAFAVLVSGPAVTVDQQGAWAGLTGSSHHPAPTSQADIDAALQAPGSGYDPGPVLRTINAPVIWLNGEKDGQVPTALNTQILLGLHKPNFEVHVLPGTGHSLLESGTGLIGDEDRAPRLAHDLFNLIAAFLATR